LVIISSWVRDTRGTIATKKPNKNGNWLKRILIKYNPDEAIPRQSKAKTPRERLAASLEARGSNAVTLEKLSKLGTCASAAFKIDPPETEATQRTRR
jgi:hypothetical protein